jgi:hypothetical protein
MEDLENLIARSAKRTKIHSRVPNGSFKFGR